MTEEHYGADDELHHIKRKLSNAKDDIEAVGEDTGATLTHYGRLTKEKSHGLWRDIDERLERAIHKTKTKAEVAPAEEAEDYSKMASGLHALREDMRNHFSKVEDDTPQEENVDAISEFHERVDGHLDWMRKSGREW